MQLPYICDKFVAVKVLNIGILLIGFLFVACNQGEKKARALEITAVENKLEVSSHLDRAGTLATQALIQSYFPLKDALVATDAQQSKMAAKAFSEAIMGYREQVDSTAWANLGLQTQVDSMLQEVTTMMTIEDATCEHQRVVFGTISRQLFKIISLVQLKNAHLYRQYCPMAFNDQGAHWISDATEIRNPYFGKMMLECGEVTDTL